MDIIPVAVEIRLVSDGVLPETPLRDGCFSPALPGYVASLSRSDPAQIPFIEQPFDLFPPDGIICIALWECPDAVEVVR